MEHVCQVLASRVLFALRNAGVPDCVVVLLHYLATYSTIARASSGRPLQPGNMFVEGVRSLCRKHIPDKFWAGRLRGTSLGFRLFALAVGLYRGPPHGTAKRKSFNP